MSLARPRRPAPFVLAHLVSKPCIVPNADSCIEIDANQCGALAQKSIFEKESVVKLDETQRTADRHLMLHTSTKVPDEHSLCLKA